MKITRISGWEYWTSIGEVRIHYNLWFIKQVRISAKFVVKHGRLPTIHERIEVSFLPTFQRLLMTNQIAGEDSYYHTVRKSILNTTAQLVDFISPTVIPASLAAPRSLAASEAETM